MDNDALQRLLDEVTPGPWAGFNMVHADQGRAMTPDEIGEYVCNSVKLGDPSRFLFVSGTQADGVDVDVCHTGNGPRGPANTALVALAPTLAAEVIALRAQLSQARAEGYREGIEAAEKVAGRVASDFTDKIGGPDSVAENQALADCRFGAGKALDAIRALAQQEGA